MTLHRGISPPSPAMAPLTPWPFPSSGPLTSAVSAAVQGACLRSSGARLPALATRITHPGLRRFRTKRPPGAPSCHALVAAPQAAQAVPHGAAHSAGPPAAQANPLGPPLGCTTTTTRVHHSSCTTAGLAASVWACHLHEHECQVDAGQWMGSAFLLQGGTPFYYFVRLYYDGDFALQPPVTDDTE
eukprot:jgi/Ulvmu1/11933/UM082_0012.1